MSKKHCSRCGQKAEMKYNPYNVTFKNYHFGRYEKDGEGFFCLKCAEFFVKVNNKCKGGHWEIENPSQNDEDNPRFCNCGAKITPFVFICLNCYWKGCSWNCCVQDWKRVHWSAWDS